MDSRDCPSVNYLSPYFILDCFSAYSASRSMRTSVLFYNVNAFVNVTFDVFWKFPQLKQAELSVGSNDVLSVDRLFSM